MVDRTVGRVALRQVPDIAADAEKCASEFRKTGTAVGNTQVAKNKDSVPEEWTGAAADAASDEIMKLGAKTKTLSEAFPPAADAVDTWISEVDTTRTTVTSLQEQWDEAIATYDRAISDAKEHYTAGDPSRKIQFDIAAQTAVDTQNNLKKQYDEQLDTLAAAAQTAANSINAARQTIVPDEAMQRRRDGIGAAIFPPDEMPTVNGAARWAEAQAEAGLLAYDLEKAANSDKPLTEEEVQALQDKWGDKLKDPFYVQALADKYRSEHATDGGLADLMYRLSINVAGNETDSNRNYAIRNSFIETIGTALTLSTGGVNASGNGLATSETYTAVKDALLGGDGKTTIAQIESNNVADMISTGDKEYNRKGGLGPHQAGTILYGYDILTQATAFAGAKNPELAFGAAVYEGGDKSLAAKLVQYDYDQKSGQGIQDLNSPNIDPSNQYGTKLPSHSEFAYRGSILGHSTADDALIRKCADPLQSLYLLSDTPESMEGDGFIKSNPSLAKFEQNRLVSLRGFLQQNTPFEVTGDWDRDGASSSEPISMVRYLTGNRNYGASGDGIFRGFVDGGDAFGEMIEDATKQLDDAKKALLPNWETAAFQQAQVAGDFIAGYQDGLDYDDRKEGAQDKFGATNSVLRSHAGVVLGNWVESLAESGNTSLASGTTAANSTLEGRVSDQTGQPLFKLAPGLRDALYKEGGLFEDFAFDNPTQLAGKDTTDTGDDKWEGGRPPALTSVMYGAYGGLKHDLEMADKGTFRPGDDWESSVVESVNKWGPILSHIENAPAHLGAAERAVVAQRNQDVRDTIDFWAKLVPFDKIPGSKIVEEAVSTAADKVKDGWFDTWLPTDFSKQDLQGRVNATVDATGKVIDTLAEHYYSQEEWPNFVGKSKQELLNDFAEEELSHSNGFRLDENGNAPDYSTLTLEQKDRFIDFIKGRSKIYLAFNGAGNVTWKEFTRIELSTTPTTTR